MPSVGDTICGDVRLEAHAVASLGAIPLQPVFLARSGPAGEPMWLLAIGKVFLPTSMDVSRFMAGANGLLELRHPALARAVLVDREADDCFVGYEALRGAEPLAELVRRGEAAPHLARVALEVARGLAFLHAHGLVHGALTPGTVVMSNGLAVLMGYGVAPLCVADVFGPRSRKLGGDAVAPEAAAGEPITAAADVFGWGVVLASVITGARGLEAVGPVIAGEVDVPGAESILELARHALEPLPESRPRDGSELLALLQAALARAPAPGTIPPWMPRPTDHVALEELAARYLDETTSLEPAPAADPVPRGKRRTPLPNVAPGGATPREPDTPEGWLRPSEKAPPSDPLRTPGHHPRWPVAHDLGGGLRKRTFAHPGRRPQPGSPHAEIEDDTPRDPLLAATSHAPPAAVSPAVAPAPLAAPLPRERPRAAPPREELVTPEPLVDSSEDDDPPTIPASESTLPSLPEPMRAIGHYRPPRMPGPHGPPAVLLAAVLAVITGGLAVLATIRGVQTRGSFSALWDEEAVRTAELAANAAMAIARACEHDMVRLPTAADTDPFATVCIEVAEYPGWMEAPQIDVSFVDAQRLCAGRGRRLCTADEWRRACAGSQGRTWPYGDTAVSGRCRTAPSGERTNPGLSGGAAQCVTPEGVFDMVGNVAEWVADGVVLGGNIATRNPTCATEAPGPADGASRRGKATRGPIGLRCCADLR